MPLPPTPPTDDEAEGGAGPSTPGQPSDTGPPADANTGQSDAVKADDDSQETQQEQFYDPEEPPTPKQDAARNRTSAMQPVNVFIHYKLVIIFVLV